MSGIAGIINFDGAPVATGLIESMTAAMDYRGPDSINHWLRGGAALGQCMLCTTPESLVEKQPLISEDGALVLVMDGRVDNWIELRRDLIARGVKLRDKSDAELVMGAFQYWGNECLKQIDGDFSLAIWDSKKRRLFCARDPIGIKPFNYYWSGRTLVFASDLHAILALPNVPQVLNKGFLAEHLAGEWCSRDETFWQGVNRLVAAHFMVVDSSGPKIDRYWRPDLFKTLIYKDDDEYTEHYFELLSDVIGRLSRSHKQLSAEVSGGLDSSAIFAVAEKLRLDGKLNAPDIIGYTLNFEGDPDADEIEYCRAVGRHLDKPIVEVMPASLTLAEHRASARKYKELPGYPNATMAHNLMYQVAQSGSRVLLDGLGGDEWLGGSRAFYQEELSAMRLSQLLRLLKIDIQKEGIPKSLWWLARAGAAVALPEFAKRYVREIRYRRASGVVIARDLLSPELKKELSRQKSKNQPSIEELVRWPGQRGALAMLDNAYIASLHEFGDRYRAAFGFEARRPFYSSRIVEFSFMVPQRVLFSGGLKKHNHRQAMRGLLPESVLQRPTKAEFSITYYNYRSSLRRHMLEEVSKDSVNWLRSDALEGLLAARNQGGYSLHRDGLLWRLFGCGAILDQ